MYGASAAYDPRFDLLSLEWAGTEDDGVELSPWDQFVFSGFGKYYGSLGAILDPGIDIEMHPDDDLGDGTFRTPMLELSPFDYEYVKTVGFGYPGMMAVSDLGAVYEYVSDALGGWFKRIAKGVKSLGKKVGKKIGKGIKKGAKAGFKLARSKVKSKLKSLTKGPFAATMDKWKGRIKLGRKLLSKTKWGRAVVKIGDKVLKTGMKIVKPLAKHVGKWAPRLAPVAALIPGVGPAISSAMLAAGQVANAINKYGAYIEDVIVVDQKTGKKKKVKKLKVDPKKRGALVAMLKTQAAAMQKVPKAQRDALIKSLKNKPPERFARPPRRPTRASAAAAQYMSSVARKDYNTDIHRKVLQAAGGNKAKQQRISALVQQLVKLGYNVA